MREYDLAAEIVGFATSYLQHCDVRCGFLRILHSCVLMNIVGEVEPAGIPAKRKYSKLGIKRDDWHTLQ
jgi:hypothetical protein